MHHIATSGGLLIPTSIDNPTFRNLFVGSVCIFLLLGPPTDSGFQLEGIPLRYFIRIWRTIDWMISPYSTVQVPPDLLRLPFIPPSWPFLDDDDLDFVIHFTTYDPALGYPFFHALTDDGFHWFANGTTQELLYHTLAVPGSAGSLGVVEAIALPDGSALIGPSVTFGIEKFAFVLAWVSPRRHTLCTKLHRKLRLSSKCGMWLCTCTACPTRSSTTLGSMLSPTALPNFPVISTMC